MKKFLCLLFALLQDDWSGDCVHSANNIYCVFTVLGKYLYEKDGHISKFICLLALLVCLIVVCVFRIDG